MSINGLTVGRSIQINLHTPTGELVINTIISFNAKPDAVDKKIVAMNGNVIPLVFPSGFSGTMEIERTDNTLEQYWDQFEDGYYLGLNLLPSTITETITESDGSQTQYLYTNVMFKVDNLGAYSGNDTVKQSLSFMAGRRQQVL